MTVSKLKLALALSASAAALPTAADAQDYGGSRQQTQQPSRVPQPQGEAPRGQRVTRIQNVSREENAAILPLYQATQAHDWAAATAALPAARAGAQSPYARYLVGRLQLDIGTNTQNQAIQAEAVAAMIASGAAPAETMAPLLGAQVQFLIQANNLAAAEAPLTRLLELDPNNVDRIIQLGQIKFRLNKREEGNALYQRALQLSSANGQTPPEILYRRVLGASYEAHEGRRTIELTRTLLNAYPNPTNWRDALLIYRESTQVDGPLGLDISRLMRVTGGLTSEADFVGFALELNRGGLPGEVKAVLDEGVSRNVLRASSTNVSELLASANGRIAEDRAGLARTRTQALAAANGRAARTTADAYFGYGQYAEAAELYRAALQKGGEDANLVNTRLGAALALAGQRAEAEAALRAVTGPRADLAQYWLIWLARRPA